MNIRHLIQGEELPEKLRSGYECGQCDPSWIWVAEHEGKPVAILVAAPAHIVVILIRICATDDAPFDAIQRMIIDAFVEMDGRGYKGYVLWLSPVSEQHMIRIVQSAGGVLITEPQVCCCGSLKDAFRKGRAA